MQKTKFEYEILIHDDASTDKTSDIIRFYEGKYPGIIKPVYQIENQYSKGTKIALLNMERAKGKYVAFCEGDDYWTDPNKLQKQVDYMEQHPECSLCVHATYMVTPDKKMLKQHIRPSIGSKIIPAEDVIMYDEKSYFHTSSLLFPRKFIPDIPDFYKKAPVGDYPLSIYLALKGNVYYIDGYMSAYRNNVPGSWTVRVLKNKEQNMKLLYDINSMLDDVNQYCNYKYDGVIKEAKKEEYKKFYLQIGAISRAKITFKECFPGISKLIILFKKSI